MFTKTTLVDVIGARSTAASFLHSAQVAKAPGCRCCKDLEIQHEMFRSSAAVAAAVVAERVRRHLLALRAPDVAHACSAGALEQLERLSELLEARRWPLSCIEFSGLLSTLSVGFRLPPRGHAPETTAELLTLEDGGTVKLSWRRAWQSDVQRGGGAPLGVVLVLPGLNNSSHLPFMQHTMALLARRGFMVVCLDYRGVGLGLTSARIASADSWRDLPEVIRAIDRRRRPSTPLFALGLSMGGSNLAKHLSVVGSASPIRAAVTISAPLDLSAAMRDLEDGVVARCVNCLTTAIAKLQFASQLLHAETRSHAAAIDWRALACATSLRELEAATVCRLHGYADPEDYYATNRPDVGSVATPWLCVHARDDPVISAASLPLQALRSNPNVLLLVTRTGGHLGYGASPRRRLRRTGEAAGAAVGGGGDAHGGDGAWWREPSWTDELCAHFLRQHAGAGAASKL